MEWEKATEDVNLGHHVGGYLIHLHYNSKENCGNW